MSSSLEIPKSIEEYAELIEWLDDLKLRSRAGSEWVDAYRWYSKNDLYFFFRHVLDVGKAVHNPTGLPVYDHKLYVDMARSTEFHIQHGYGINTSSRRMGKSEMRSCAAPLWILLNYPDAAIGIVSVEKALALRHLVRIKNELERNQLLSLLFEDIFWIDPQEEAKSHSLTWSKADGFVIKGRKSNRPNSSLEVNSLFGGGPVGSGYDVIIADDIERRDRVGTQAAVDELDMAFSEAISLLTPVALPRPVLLISNTRFSEIGLIHRKAQEFVAEDPKLLFEVPAEVIESHHTDEYVWQPHARGPLQGKINWPYTEDYLKTKFRTMASQSEYILQFSLSFRSASEMSLDENKLHYYDKLAVDLAPDMTVYICIDPSRGKRDPLAVWVWGLTVDKRKFWLDSKIGKFDITSQEFHDMLFGLVSKWEKCSQRLIEVRVEDTANSAWAQLVENELRNRRSYVPVVKVGVHSRIAEQKFATGKADRIYGHWSPMLNRGEVWFPTPVSKGGHGILCDMNQDGTHRDLVDYFLSVEMRPFPAGKHDDGLDAGGMLMDNKTNQDRPLVYPVDNSQIRRERAKMFGNSSGRRTSWMSAG